MKERSIQKNNNKFETNLSISNKRSFQRKEQRRKHKINQNEIPSVATEALMILLIKKWGHTFQN